MIKLLAIQPVAERGGSDQALVRMLRSLPPDEFECHVVVPAEPPLRAEFESAGVSIHVLPMARISTSHSWRDWSTYVLAWPVAVVRLAALITRCGIDVVHTNSLHSWYGWAAATITRRAHVWHAREIVVQSGAALRVERFLVRHCADRVICMSQAIADQLDPANTVVIRETADPEEFSPNRAGRFRATAGIPDDAPLVGAAGRVDTWKGFDVLLDAFERAASVNPNLQLVVAGAPVTGKEDLFHRLAATADARPRVHWLGPRADLPDVLADLDVFVLPSTQPEPYGLVAVEALASGVPAVVSDAGGPREIAADARPGAVRLVPPGDVAALADAVLAALEAAGPTSTSRRRARPVLRDPEPERFGAVFRGVLSRRAPLIRAGSKVGPGARHPHPPPERT
jgi:glycosyltransferase involved in cell wall biosynthesis